MTPAQLSSMFDDLNDQNRKLEVAVGGPDVDEQIEWGTPQDLVDLAALASQSPRV